MRYANTDLSQRDKSVFRLPTPKMRENACQYGEVSEKIVRLRLIEHENAPEGVT